MGDGMIKNCGKPFVVVILCVIFLFVYVSGCSVKKVPGEPFFPENTHVQTLTVTATPSMTAVDTVTPENSPVFTPSVTCTETEAYSETETQTQANTQTQTATYTATLISTPTATATNTVFVYAPICAVPLIYGFEDSMQRYSYTYAAGNTITAGVNTFFPNVPVKIRLYDGGIGLNGHTVLDTVVLTSNAQGIINYQYTMTGTEDSDGNWLLLAGSVPASFPEYAFPGLTYNVYDYEVIKVVMTPTPVTAMPCVNMPIVCSDPDYLMEEYRFKLSACNTVFYLNTFTLFDSGKVAFYDGANNLIHVETSYKNNYNGVNGLAARYTVSGAETAGNWHILLFSETAEPPSVYTGPAGYSQCPYITLKVESLLPVINFD